MLENEPQIHIPSTLLPGENTQANRRVYVISLGLIVALVLLACVLGVLTSPAQALGAVLVQFAVGLGVLAFVVGGDWLSETGRFSIRMWQNCALLCAAIVTIASFLTGEYLFILLAPLLVGLGQRRGDSYGIVRLGLAGATLVGLSLSLAYLLKLDRPQASEAQVALTALAALSLSLATFLRHFQRQLQRFHDEAASNTSEMEVAHEIQTSLMPPNHFTSGSWTLAARSLPAKDVGGDFYEYINHPHLDQWISGIAIGDVAGKGIPAALQMAVVRTLFRVEARRRIFPAETLMSVNLALQAERSFGMVTMLYAFIDIQNDNLHLANAGHNYPILLNGTLDEIKLPGLPLGIDDEIEYEEKVIKILPGTSVIFYTDGVVEAMNPAGELFTFERLKESIAANHDLEPSDMVEKILAEIAIFTESAAQSDDITVLVLQYHPQPGETKEGNGVPQPVGVRTERLSVLSDESHVEIDENGANWI